MKNRKTFKAVVLSVVLVLLIAACSSGGNSANSKDQTTAKQQLSNAQAAQPVPNFTFSQLRQNLIEIETAQANTTQTTSFFYNNGSNKPVSSCPSIGFPIPTTDQLTNPEQVTYDGSGGVAFPQIEANLVYTGQSSGTYVICVDAQGETYAFYWEGWVGTISGPGTYNETTGQVELTGKPSFSFSKDKATAPPASTTSTTKP